MTRTVLYSTAGEDITRYDVDADGATLTARETVKARAVVQYVWPHPSRRWIYVTSSNRGSGPGMDESINHVAAYRVDPATGALSAHGEARVLPKRAVHLCVDATGRYVLNAHNLPKSGLTVHRINDDGTLGEEVAQPPGLDYGIYPHQVRITPSNRITMLVDRGNKATATKAEDPGALRLFRLNNGVHTPLEMVAPNGGHGFGIRHLDFHPSQPWVYISLEIQSLLHMFRLSGDGIETQPAYVCDTLTERATIKPYQQTGTIHVHPNGRSVYVANRADSKVDFNGRKVFAGGENSIAVFAIDPHSGEPKLIQHAPTNSYHVRTFSIDPSGTLMVAASVKPIAVRAGDEVTTVPPALSVFRIGDDGRLAFVRKYDVDTGGRVQYWMGMLELPAS